MIRPNDSRLGRWADALDRHLPPELLSPPDVRLRARLGVLFPLIYVAVGCLFLAIYLTTGMYTFAVTLGLTLPIMAAAPTLLVRGKSLELSAHVFAFVFYLLLLTFTVLQGGTDFRALAWTGTLLVYTLFLGGRRPAAIWTLVSIVGNGVLYYLESVDFEFPKPIMIGFGVFDVANISLSGIVVLALAMLYERMNGRILAELSSAGNELERIRYGLEEAQRLAKVGSWEVDLVNETSRWSPMMFQIFGLDPGPRSEGKSIQAVAERWIHADDRARFVERMEQHQATKEQLEIDLQLVQASGRTRIVHCVSSVVGVAEDRVTALRLTMQDVTETKQVETELIRAREEALEASKTKSQFLANMSHEIRTPMNGVLGMTELALSTGLDGEQREYVAAAHAAGKSLLSIIDDILDLSKVEAGRVTIEQVPFSLPELLQAAIEPLAHRGQQKGLEMVLDVDPAIGDYFRGDPLRARQILVNLLSNAVKFTERGNVVVSVERGRRGGDWIDFTVEDSGPGISAENQRLVFEAFRQADGSTTRRFGGTGLGLTISRQLAELMGGTLLLDSEPGRGSRFTLSLPLPALEQGEKRARPRVRGPILVVDDHPRARSALTRTLESVGIEVRAYASAAEVLRDLAIPSRRTRFRTAVIDANLGGSDGLALVKDLRARSDLPRIQVFLMVDAGPRPSVEALAAVGGARMLQKPCSRAVLLDALGSVSPVGEGTFDLPQSAPAERLRVLLAEDNPVNALVATRFLERSGHRVERVENGRQAVDAVLSTRFDVVLMDLQMPEVDGILATKMIRSHEATHGGHVKIIALTANAMKGDDEACLAAGMDAYLSKPIDPVRLEEVVRKTTQKPNLELQAG